MLRDLHLAISNQFVHQIFKDSHISEKSMVTGMGKLIQKLF